MNKNPLSAIYESRVLTTEGVPSNKVKGEKELEAKMDAKKAHLVSGQGPEAAKKNIKTPQELKGTEVHAPAVLKDSMQTEEPKKAFEGAFEKLFKSTINEQFPGSEELGGEDTNVEVPTSEEGMVDELEGEKDEVSDLVSDLKSVIDHLQGILDKISEETGEGSEEAEHEFGGEENEENEEEVKEEMEESPVKEATELKPLGDKSKVLQGKNDKVGSVKPHGGKAHSGDIESDPELKAAKSFDKSLQSPKGKPEVKSTVKKGEFFK